MTYADRQNVVYLDGTRIFQTAEDRRNEEEIAALVAEAWKCRVAYFGALSPIDWYAERFGRMVGLLELKGRTHASHHFATVFLNVRKWLALTIGSMGMNCPAVFVVRFTDQVRWIPLTSIDAAKHRIAGCAHIVKNQNDIEPVIEVPIRNMRRLA
jgi:hypothetical protein